MFAIVRNPMMTKRCLKWPKLKPFRLLKKRKRFKKLMAKRFSLAKNIIGKIGISIKDPNKSNTQKNFRHSNVKRYELALLRSGYFFYFGRLHAITPITRHLSICLWEHGPAWLLTSNEYFYGIYRRYTCVDILHADEAVPTRLADDSAECISEHFHDIGLYHKARIDFN